MNRAHRAGITGVQTLLVANAPSSNHRGPAGLRFHRTRGAYYLAARDADRQMFNRCFGTSLLTEESARRELEALRGRVDNEYRDYAPIDFGGGLSFGRIPSTESGTGRWEFFNGPIVEPLVAGRRVLDLGCNNGALTLMMLRAGASEVVGIELTPEIADVARLNVRILSWRDARDYRCDVLTGDMRAWLTRDLGHFDVVTAFCSLYYLPEPEMARIIRKAADTNATLIVQSNDEIENLPAQTGVLRRLMEANGYGDVAVYAYPGFERPLLVAAVGARAGDNVQSETRGILCAPSQRSS
jgi:SAM-dependent methyltransferase